MAWIASNTLRSHVNVDLLAPQQAVHNDIKLTFYENPPTNDISIHDFEIYALDRLRALKGLEHAKSQGKKDKELDTVIQQLCSKHLKGVDAAASRLKDAVSHFALRLAFCTTEDNRRWLLTQECELFRHRFGAFMRASDLPYHPISAEEILELQSQLSQMCQSGAVQGKVKPDLSSKEFHKVPFEQVPDLVGSRKVFLNKGMAYVPKDLLSSLLVASFRQKLSRSLVITAGRWATSVAAQEGDRLTPIIHSLSSRHVTQDIQGPATQGAPGEKISLAQIPALSQRHFPLCMQSLYGNLMTDRHLRHAGRMQLSLFLKRMGLTMDESMYFWKQAFAPKTPGDKFDKEYAYNVRHSYGKEGRRKDYEPHNCMKVISASPGVGEYHGCPFKTMPEANLRAAVTRMGVSTMMTQEIVEKAKGSHFQVACARTFEGLFGEAPDAGVTHPNSYLSESMAIVSARDSARAQQTSDATGPAGTGGVGGVRQTPSGAGQIPLGVGQTPLGAGQTPSGPGQTPSGPGQTPSAAGIPGMSGMHGGPGVAAFPGAVGVAYGAGGRGGAGVAGAHAPATPASVAATVGATATPYPGGGGMFAGGSVSPSTGGRNTSQHSPSEQRDWLRTPMLATPATAAPGNAPGTAPGNAPGTAPGTAPGSAAGSASVSTPASGRASGVGHLTTPAFATSSTPAFATSSTPAVATFTAAAGSAGSGGLPGATPSLQGFQSRAGAPVDTLPSAAGFGALVNNAAAASPSIRLDDDAAQAAGTEGLTTPTKRARVGAASAQDGALDLTPVK